MKFIESNYLKNQHNTCEPIQHSSGCESLLHFPSREANLYAGNHRVYVGKETGSRVKISRLSPCNVALTYLGLCQLLSRWTRHIFLLRK